MPPWPLVLRLPPNLLGRFETLPHPNVGDAPGSLRARLASCFTMSPDEEAFARELLRHKKNHWLFRSNQRSRCGDFVIVDMSPALARREAWVVELKQGQPLRQGGAGLQLSRAREGVEAVASCSRALLPAAPYALLVGDRAELLRRFLG